MNKFNPALESAQIVLDPYVEYIPFSFKIRWEHAFFGDGEYSFRYSIPGRGAQPIEMVIRNPHLRSEFQHITPYFEKLFNSKFFVVSGTAKFVNNAFAEVTEVDSEELMAIDEATISKFREKQIQQLQKVTGASDKSLHDLKSLIAGLPDQFDKENGLSLQSIDIIDYFSGEKEIRNKDHLKYLAKHQDQTPQKLLFTQRPYFGFLFSIETTSSHCFVWELLNSHATYVWVISKSFGDYSWAKERVDTSVSQIIGSGRAQYRRAYGAREIDSDIGYCTIDHKENGFKHWSKEIERLIA